jgi:membrane-associated phospholipid phosphatase
MDLTSSVDTDLQVSLPITTNTKSRRIARWVSKVGSPPVLATAGTLLSARAVALPAAWYWAGFTILTSIFFPVMYIYWLLRRGKISDFDIYYRDQRLKPYFFVMACGGLSLLVMQISLAPHLIIVLTGASLTQTLLMSIINLRWKISAHAAAMAGFAVLCFYLVGVLGVLFLLGIPLMIWSRVLLHRHTLGQTIVGSLLGAIIFSVFLLLI